MAQYLRHERRRREDTITSKDTKTSSSGVSIRWVRSSGPWLWGGWSSQDICASGRPVTLVISLHLSGTRLSAHGRQALTRCSNLRSLPVESAPQVWSHLGITRKVETTFVMQKFSHNPTPTAPYPNEAMFGMSPSTLLRTRPKQYFRSQQNAGQGESSVLTVAAKLTAKVCARSIRCP